MRGLGFACLIIGLSRHFCKSSDQRAESFINHRPLRGARQFCFLLPLVGHDRLSSALASRSVFQAQDSVIAAALRGHTLDTAPAARADRPTWSIGESAKGVAQNLRGSRFPAGYFAGLRHVRSARESFARSLPAALALGGTGHAGPGGFAALMRRG